MQNISIHILVMGGPPFFLTVLSQPLGPGDHTGFCTSALLLIQGVVTYSVKSDPEMSVFHLEWSIFVQIIHLLRGFREFIPRGINSSLNV
jgi:hypothetical protein